VAVGTGHHLFNLGKKGEVAAEVVPDHSRNRTSRHKNWFSLDGERQSAFRWIRVHLCSV
jgi:hypothetical protein